MKYLLDTNIIVDHLRNKKLLDEYLLLDGVGISIITVAELFYGAYKSDNPPIMIQKLENVIKKLNIEIVNLNLQTISEFGKIKAGLEVKGERLEDFDLLIAATAIVNKLILVTLNIKHFKRIENLELVA